MANTNQHLFLVSTVRRELRHVLKFSKPVVMAPKTTPRGMLSSRGLVAIRDLHLPVHYDTHRSPSGWGSRFLVTDEHRLIFDIPTWIVNPAAVFDEERPLKGAMAVASAALAVFGRRQSEPALVCAALGHSLTLEPSATWLPALNRWLPGGWAIPPPGVGKLGKADDALVHTAPWRLRVTLVVPMYWKRASRHTSSANVWDALDLFVQHIYWRLLYRSLLRYLRSTYGLTVFTWLRDARTNRSLGYSQQAPKRRKMGDDVNHDCTQEVELLRNVEVGLQVLKQNQGSFTAIKGAPHPSSWEWSTGSAPIFWHWADPEQRRVARDGMKAFIRGPLPLGRGEERPRIKKQDSSKVYSKLCKILTHQYVVPGFIRHCLHYFAVPKGPDDIRMVYDGTKGGLNDALWAPSFYLPDTTACTWFLDYESWIFDLDFGECFLNFRQSPELLAYSGISLAPFTAEVRRDFPDMFVLPAIGTPWVQWTRLFMGSTFSPYAVGRQVHWIMEMARGDPGDPANVFRYDSVILNLPGSPDYNPARPKVMRWDSIDDCMACSEEMYVDDC
jgi:hypothetical protein